MLHYDGGPWSRAGHYQAEIDHLGIARSPAHHYEPETNGCVATFIQTLNEQVLWIERCDTLEQLRVRIHRFARGVNERWLLERHGSRARQARERSVSPPRHDAAFTNQSPVNGGRRSTGWEYEPSTLLPLQRGASLLPPWFVRQPAWTRAAGANAKTLVPRFQRE